MEIETFSPEQKKESIRQIQEALTEVNHEPLKAKEWNLTDQPKNLVMAE